MCPAGFFGEGCAMPTSTISLAKSQYHLTEPRQWQDKMQPLLVQLTRSPSSVDADAIEIVEVMGNSTAAKGKDYNIVPPFDNVTWVNATNGYLTLQFELFPDSLYELGETLDMRIVKHPVLYQDSMLKGPLDLRITIADQPGCPPGQFYLSTKPACIPCPVNTFSETTDMSEECDACPKNSATAFSTGSDRASACLCNGPGYVGSIQSKGSICAACPIETLRSSDAYECCPGGENMTVPAGYFKFSGDASMAIFRCRSKGCAKTSVDMAGGSGCMEGFEGPVCGTCQDSWTMLQGKCIKCISSEITVRVVVVVVLLVGLALAAVVRIVYSTIRREIQVTDQTVREVVASRFSQVQREFRPLLRDALGDKTSIVLGFYQKVGPLGTVLLVEFPDVGVAAFFNIFSFDFLDMLPLSCGGIGDLMNYHGKLMVHCVVPLATLIFVVSVGMVARAMKNAPLEEQIVTLAVGFANLVYAGITTDLFAYFQCQAYGENGRYLIRDHTVDCEGDDYRSMAPFVIGMMLVWPIGVPAMYAALLWRQQAVFTDRIEQARIKRAATSLLSSSFLYGGGGAGAYQARVSNPMVPMPTRSRRPEDLAALERSISQILQVTSKERTQIPSEVNSFVEHFKPKSFYFELCQISHKLLLVGFLNFVAQGSFDQVLCGILLCVAFFSLFAMTLPYREETLDNVVALLSEAMVVFIMASTVVLKADRLSNTGTSPVVVVLIHLATVAPVAGAVVASLVVLSRGSIRGRSSSEAARKLAAGPREPERNGDDGRPSQATTYGAPGDESAPSGGMLYLRDNSEPLDLKGGEASGLGPQSGQDQKLLLVLLDTPSAHSL